MDGPGGGSGLVARPVFKTATETPSAALVGSIPTRSRHPSLPVSILLCMVLVVGARDLNAQGPPSVAGAASPDSGASTEQVLSPAGAFLRSFLVPGWAQAKLDRRLTAALFIAWEGVTLGMSLKTHHELGVLRRREDERTDSKRQEREDWLILLAFNHLLSGLEAFVSSQLTDFPTDVKLRATPDAPGVMGTIPFRIR